MAFSKKHTLQCIFPPEIHLKYILNIYTQHIFSMNLYIHLYIHFIVFFFYLFFCGMGSYFKCMHLCSSRARCCICRGLAMFYISLLSKSSLRSQKAFSCGSMEVTLCSSRQSQWAHRKSIVFSMPLRWRSQRKSRVFCCSLCLSYLTVSNKPVVISCW